MPTPEAVVPSDAKLQHTQYAKARSLLTIATVSLSLVIPCIWQPHIESTDLATHVYNSWLARLIATEHLTGLWINHQLTNVVFDYLLTWLLGAFGPLAAERIAAVQLLPLRGLLFRCPSAAVEPDAVEVGTWGWGNSGRMLLSPLGSAWAIATALYICTARNRTRKVQAALFSAAALAIAAVGLFQQIRL